MGFGGAESLRGDARWHGVCLALAELARRGLVKEDVLGETVTWVLKVCRTLREIVRGLMIGTLVRLAKGITFGRSQRPGCRCLSTVVTITSMLACSLRAFCRRYRYRSHSSCMFRQRGWSTKSSECSLPRKCGQTSKSSDAGVISAYK
jgi:hypothetical protein